MWYSVLMFFYIATTAFDINSQFDIFCVIRQFAFYGHRDFYSLVSYLKFRLQQDNITFRDDMLLIEAVVRNFGGTNRKDMESMCFDSYCALVSD